jgi:molybdenum cofactor cytidylyltransferase
LEKTKIPVLILAAGQSCRLGRPKQLVQYQGDTLLNNAINTALEFTDTVAVILGANYELISEGIVKSDKIKILINNNWPTGMASSIRLGVSFLGNTEAVIIILSDQPFLTKCILQKMEAEYKNTNAKIVACQYAGQLGVPILFNKLLYRQLQQLEGDEGAKKLLKNYQGEIGKVAFEKGEIDIDTEADLLKILQ